MAYHLDPLITNSPLSITCISSWNSKLIVGTEAKGVFVYNVIKFLGEQKAVPESSLSLDTPVQQLYVLLSHNLLVVLSQGMVSIYEITMKIRVTFIWKQTIKKKNIKSFSVRDDTTSPALCVATDNSVQVYEYNHGLFQIAKKHHYFGDLTSFASTNTFLYMMLQQNQLYNLSVCSIATDHDIHHSFHGEGPVFVKYISSYSVLLHQHSTSKIYTNGTLEKQFSWTIVPMSIVIFDKCCIGLAKEIIEIIDLRSGKSRLIELSSQDQQNYMVDEHAMYVASKDSVWCMVRSVDESNEKIHNNRSERDQEEDEEVRENDAISNRHERDSKGYDGESDESGSEGSWEAPDCSLEMPSNFSPENTLDVLGMLEIDIKCFSEVGVKTVRQFAQIPQRRVIQLHPSSRYAHELALSYIAQYQSLLDKKYGRGRIKPDDLVEALLLTENQIAFLASVMVFTVRQFAAMSSAEVYDLGDEMVSKHIAAVEVLDLIENTGPAISPSKYGYLALNTRGFSHVIESRSVKSPYVLFHEYLECELAAKESHPWKDAWHFSAFRLDKGGMNENMTDLDLFSYLCWRGVSMFGKTDSTASARAIFFYWDRQTGINEEDDNLIRIDLSELCTSHGGTLYTEHDGGYIPTNLTALETGKKYGCIVMPSGQISWDCMSHIPLS